MKYFKLLHDFNRKDSTDMVCRSSDNIEANYGVDQYSVSQGKPIKLWNEQFSFYYDPSEGSVPTDYLINDLSWFVVSPRLRAILEATAPQDVQFLPVRILNTQDSSEISGFSVANIITVVDALDLDNSIYSFYELDGEKILAVRKHALSLHGIKGASIFRLRDDIVPIFVSEEVVNVISRHGLTGCSFLEVKLT